MGVELEEFFGRGRHRAVVMARYVTVAVLRATTAMSFPEIARAMGRPNHSTCHTGLTRVRGLAESLVSEYIGESPTTPDESRGLTVSQLINAVAT